MKFRKATPDDAKAILTLTHTAFLRYAQEVGKAVKGTTETIDDVISDIEEKYVLVCVDDNGEIQGSVRCEQIENVVYISRLASARNASVANVGVALMEKAKEIFNVDALILHTSTKIKNLVMFYYGLGFYIADVDNTRSYPRGLFVCPLTNNKDYDPIALAKER